MTNRVVLLIDTNADDRRAIMDHLHDDRIHPYSIIEACSGREGLLAVADCHPDVIILDQDLSDIPGIDLLLALRSTGRGNVPVVFLTRSATLDTSAVDPLELGADDFLDKEEISGAHLRRAVSNAITKARMRVALEESQASLKSALAEVRQRMEFEARLIAVVGHDLRTPLGSITAGIEVLRMEPSLTQRGERVLARLARSTTHMTTIVRQVFDMTGMRRGGAFSVEAAPCDLQAVVEDRVEELRAYYRDRTIRVSSSGDCRGFYDPTALGQVIVNLVSNSITHGAAESPVDVTVTGLPQTITVAVSNKGAPIPSSEQESLFQPFTRSRRAGGQGLGLGLYIAKGIADAHDARIDVASDDEGTTFSLVLPRKGP